MGVLNLEREILYRFECRECGSTLVAPLTEKSELVRCPVCSIKTDESCREILRILYDIHENVLSHFSRFSLEILDSIPQHGIRSVEHLRLAVKCRDCKARLEFDLKRSAPLLARYRETGERPSCPNCGGDWSTLIRFLEYFSDLERAISGCRRTHLVFLNQEKNGEREG